MSDTATSQKHTPGPWHVGIRDGYPDIFDKDGHWLASIPWDAELIDVQSNARLIAAAPELLEALQEVLVTGACLQERHPTTIDRVVAAIAKAEGKV